MQWVTHCSDRHWEGAKFSSAIDYVAVNNVFFYGELRFFFSSKKKNGVNNSSWYHLEDEMSSVWNSLWPKMDIKQHNEHLATATKSRCRQQIVVITEQLFELHLTVTKISPLLDSSCNY